ncbi:hypothetical protein N8013_05455 [Algibacter sp.]|nr:hypothetical protein [Algibacter sp.]
MDLKIKKEIQKRLKKGQSISFEAETALQGGPLVHVFINNANVGEVYTYNSEKKCHENISAGSPKDNELGDAIKEWVHNEYFDFMRCNDELLREYYECSFKLDGNDILLEINIHEEDEYGETVYDDDEDPVFDSYTVTIEEIELSIRAIEDED